MPAVLTLERPLYTYTEAARLLDLPATTLRWWLEGATRAGVTYPPVLRREATGADSVTWGEFVEAGLLRGYRSKKVSMQKMRPFIERMRERLGLPYPLAHYKPLVDPATRKLVYEIQDEEDLPDGLHLVEFEGEQMVLAPVIVDFLDRVEFDGGPALRYWPQGKESPVVIDPNVSFGVPQIRGVRTELVAESIDAGETEDEAARAWNLSPAEVQAALSWERRAA